MTGRPLEYFRHFDLTVAPLLSYFSFLLEDLTSDRLDNFLNLFDTD